MTMRHTLHARPSSPVSYFPLLDSGDLPGAEDWSVIESLRGDDMLDSDDDRWATLAIARAFDE